MAARQIWERQGRESDEAFEAFKIYLHLGVERSTAKVAEQLGKSLSLIQRWSAEWHWVERCRAFDNYLFEKELKEVEQDRVRARRMHANVSRMVQAKVVKKLQAMTEEDVNRMSNADVIKWFYVAIKVELLALGVPTSRTGGDELVDLQKKLKENARRAWEEAPLRYPTIAESRRLEILAEVFGVEPDQFLSWAGVKEQPGLM